MVLGAGTLLGWPPSTLALILPGEVYVIFIVYTKACNTDCDQINIFSLIFSTVQCYL